MKLKIIFAMDIYFNRHYTWIYNQLNNFRNTCVTVLAQYATSDFREYNWPEHKVFYYQYFGKPSFLSKILWILGLFFIDVFVLSRKIKKEKYELIHAHFAPVGYRYIRLAKSKKIPLVVSFYGFDYDRLPNTRKLWVKRYEKLFKNTDMFLTEGEFGRKKLIKKGISPGKIKVHHLGVDVENIPYNKRVFDGNGLLRLVQIASFHEKKGHRVLIEAMRYLKEISLVSSVSLTIIGKGPLKSEIIDLVNEYELNDIVIFKDSIAYSELHSELLKYHIFIHPSITAKTGDCEGGAPVVILDAQATGMPVISTLHCDIPEEVIDGETGLLVEEGDHVALTEAVLKFLNEPGLLSEYGRKAREHVELNYSAVKQSEKLEQIYRDLIKQQS